MADVEEPDEEVAAAPSDGHARVPSVARPQQAVAVGKMHHLVHSLQQGTPPLEGARLGEQHVEGEKAPIAMHVQLPLPVEALCVVLDDEDVPRVQMVGREAIVGVDSWLDLVCHPALYELRNLGDCTQGLIAGGKVLVTLRGGSKRRGNQRERVRRGGHRLLTLTFHDVRRAWASAASMIHELSLGVNMGNVYMWYRALDACGMRYMVSATLCMWRSRRTFGREISTSGSRSSMLGEPRTAYAVLGECTA